MGPFFPLLLMGFSNYISGRMLNTSALSSPDLTPRFGQTDARTLGVGLGILGLLLAPFMPIIGAIGLGIGTASLLNYDTMAKVQVAADAFIAAQGPAGLLSAPGMPGLAQLPGLLAPLFRGEAA